MQSFFITLEYKILVAFISPLSINKNIKDKIRGSCSKIDARQNNIALILFFLFNL